MTRVSSAAMRRASRRVRTARGLMSSRLPIGVATRYRVPMQQLNHRRTRMKTGKDVAEVYLQQLSVKLIGDQPMKSF